MKSPFEPFQCNLALAATGCEPFDVPLAIHGATCEVVKMVLDFAVQHQAEFSHCFVAIP
jgi:hypothetical protein